MKGKHIFIFLHARSYSLSIYPPTATVAGPTCLLQGVKGCWGLTGW